MRPIGKRAIPELKSGPARIVVRAARPVLYGLRQAESTATRDVQVRLEPPRVAVLSTFHYINHGGSEFVVYRVDARGRRVGRARRRQGVSRLPGQRAPASPATRRCAWRSSRCSTTSRPDAPIQVFARDAAGNEAVAPLDHRVVPQAVSARAASRSTTASCSASSRRSPATSPDEQIPTDDVAGRAS